MFRVRVNFVLSFDSCGRVRINPILPDPNLTRSSHWRYIFSLRCGSGRSDSVFFFFGFGSISYGVLILAVRFGLTRFTRTHPDPRFRLELFIFCGGAIRVDLILFLGELRVNFGLILGNWVRVKQFFQKKFKILSQMKNYIYEYE